MDKVIQVIATILLIGVLFVAVLSYSNITGFAPVLNQIKEGVGKLVGWFIPPKYNVTLAAENITGVTASGRTFILDNVTTSAATTIGKITIDLGNVKDYYPNARFVVLSNIEGVTVGLSVLEAKNATVVINGNEIVVYPHGGEAIAKIAVTISAGSNISGRITIADVRY
jgi:hypothetical protein